MKKEERIHALDTVRAFALISGIVLHAAMSFMPGLAALGFPADHSQSVALQTTFYVIHIFRMTLFFFIAGYFAHWMFHRQGAPAFLRDRAKRILLPLVVGWAFFGPMAMALVYMTLAPVIPNAAPALSGLPLAHLWFLYYLMLFYAAMLAVRAVFVKHMDRTGAVRAQLDGLVQRLLATHLGPLAIAAPAAACLYLTPNWVMWGGIPTPDIGLVPQPPATIAYGSAFAFGWLMHRQSQLLAMLRKSWALYFIAAAGLTWISHWLVQQAPNPFAVEPALKAAYAMSYTLAAWNGVFALIGIALRFFSTQNVVSRYLADASYWMYVAHLPLVFALQMMVREWPLHWTLKFPLIVTAALALLLLTYHLAVRGTVIGEVLNGRRKGSVTHQSDASSVSAAPRSVMDGKGSEVVAELRAACKQFGEVIALDKLDLQVRRGEVLALLGPNGAGKSTAISLLLGLQQVDAGTVTLFGQSPDAPDFIAARRQIGVMLQEVALQSESRVAELIDLTSSYYARPLGVREVLTLTNTTHLANRPYAKLSGGQQRLVQFALAVCGRPQLLFLDEPTTGLDLRAREAMWSTIRGLVDAGSSIVLTTHYLEEAEALADRVAVVAKGRLVASGSIDQVRALVSRKLIRCLTTLSAEHIRRWPDVAHVLTEGAHLEVCALDAESVARRLLLEDPSLRELEVTRAGLAEAFVELTKEAA